MDFSLTENLISNALKSKKNRDGHLRIYYNVVPLYLGEEEVPRAMLQQAISNDPDTFEDLIRLVPNIDVSHKINYSRWDHKDNLLKA